jgi:hypothetical protein
MCRNKLSNITYCEPLVQALIYTVNKSMGFELSKLNRFYERYWGNKCELYSLILPATERQSYYQIFEQFPYR